MMKILVIDNESAVLAVASQALIEAGHRVEVAGDGAAGLRVLARWTADLVITDIIMPVQEGLQTIREVRRDYPGTKLVAMSGRRFMGELDLLDVALKLGAHRAIRKPFTAEALRACVADCLQSRRCA